MAGWSFACPDWWDRLQAGRAPIPDLPIDEEAAERAVAIYNKLRLPDVPGQPPLAEAGGEWFRDILRAAFGSVDPETGVRQVGEIFCLTPKKQAKTTNAAALGLVAMLLNRRPRAQMLIVGPTQEIAGECFEQVVGMIEADETGWLAQRFHVRDHKSDIVCRVTKARLRVKTFDMKVATGSKPSLVILDELHVMSQFASAARVIGQLRGGFAPFPDALMVTITTQSDQPPAGVFAEELEYARNVRDGKIAGTVRTLPVLYELPREIQASREKRWRDPALWPAICPNLGRSVSLDWLTEKYATERAKGIEAESRWASQHLNVEIGIALNADRWVGVDHWLPAAREAFDLDWLIEHAEVCTVGIDGGGLDDLLGLAVIGRMPETREWLVWARAWAHPEVFAQRQEIADTLRRFIAQGDLRLCDDAMQDVREVADIVMRLFEAEKLPDTAGVGLDAWGISDIYEVMVARGLPVDAMEGVAQGVKLQSAMWSVERKLKERTLRHASQPMMAWCVSNAKTERIGNNVRITKKAAGKSKIDPVIAMLNAATLMGRNPDAGARSFWEAA